MGYRILGLVLTLAVLMVPAAFAADTEVAPGDGTLAAAIAAASNGDTLILQTGQYSGDTVVDRSLVIRADTRLDEPYISGSFNVQGDGIEVTLQGLQFNTNLVLTQATDVRILENKLHSGVDIDCAAYTSTGSKLLIVGNWLSSDSEILGVGISGAYIAGNNLVFGRIFVDAPAWVVGNIATYRNSGVINVNADGIVRVIGNRLSQHTPSKTAAYGVYIGSSSNVLVSGNLIEMTWDDGNIWSGVGCYSHSQSEPYGVYVEQAESFVEVENNVIYGSSVEKKCIYGAGVSGADHVRGNIIVGMQRAAVSGGMSENNLCFNNRSNCGTSSGNLNEDPKFIDAQDFRLAEDSPAIDGGPDDATHADLDRTRNDIGAYGGPWSIEQLDIQRDPSNLGPYIYPLFDANDAFSEGGLNIRVLSVARLR